MTPAFGSGVMVQRALSKSVDQCGTHGATRQPVLTIDSYDLAI
jgi:hypothetical protein